MKTIEKLADTLAENASLYEQIAEITKKEKSILESFSLKRLNEVMREKEKIALKIKKLEQKRSALLKDIGKELGRKPGEITLRDIAETEEYGGRFGEKLMALRQRLIDAGKAVSTANDLNRNIIGGAITKVTESLQFAVGLIEPAITYSQKLSINSSTLSGRVVRKAY